MIGVDRRNPRKGTPIIKNVAYLYGHRPPESPCWYLSAYEFTRHWTLEPVRYPASLEDDEKDDRNTHARLTESGRNKLAARRGRFARPDLQPGRDYQVKASSELHAEANWHPFADTAFTAAYRNNWVLVRRNRPHDPSFLHCPMPRRGEGETERNAEIIMTYFHPFTLNPAWHEQHVPFLGQMCGNENNWQSSMLRWFDGGILSHESKRYIQNFLVVTRTRPEDDGADGNSDDLLSDEELIVDDATLEEALSTRVGSGKQRPDSRLLQDRHL